MTEKQYKRAMSILSAVVVLSLFTLCIIICVNTHTVCSRTEDEREMNQVEKNFDADGYFVMMNTEKGFMGIYDGTRPIMHVWKKDIKRLQSGVYNYCSYGLRMELWCNATEEVQSLQLTKEESEELSFIPQNIPVIVY